MHITLQRWPRDPEANPVKRSIHTRLVNELKCPEVSYTPLPTPPPESLPLGLTRLPRLPQVKAGAYVHELFNRDGIPVYLRDPDHIPATLTVDMARAVAGDIRVAQLDLPPGLTIRPVKHLPDNFLVARAKRIRS